jgi:hypothetical protein
MPGPGSRSKTSRSGRSGAAAIAPQGWSSVAREQRRTPRNALAFWDLQASGSRPSTWWKMLLGLRWPRLRRPWVEGAGFRWWAMD